MGLALSGGAARGLAHLGVLDVLDSFGITPCAIAGTSAGAIVGAAAAAKVPICSIIETACRTSWSGFARPARPGRMGLLTLEPMDKTLNKILGGVMTFEELSIPFVCVTTDVERDEVVILRNGLIAPAVRASSSVPGIFIPVQLNDRLLVDGGVQNNLPTKVLFEMGAEYIIAVDLLPIRAEATRPASIFDVMTTTFYNMIRATSHESDLADIVIIPDIRDSSFVSFDSVGTLIEKGRKATLEAMPQICRDLRIRGRESSPKGQNMSHSSNTVSY